MSQSTGIPYNIEAAQAFVESDFNATATSSKGAQGWLQFLPSTYDQFAAQAGVAPNTEFTPTDEAQVYDAYMGELLRQNRGDIRNALAAYNAGDPQSPAGQQYASEILKIAGAPDSVVPGTAVTTASMGPFPGGNWDPFNWVWGLFGGAQHAATQGINDLVGQVTKELGAALKKAWADAWKRFEPDFIRIGFILLGVVILYAGIQGFLKPPSAGPTTLLVNSAKSVRRSSRTKNSPSGDSDTGADTEAIETEAT